MFSAVSLIHCFLSESVVYYRLSETQSSYLFIIDWLTDWLADCLTDLLIDWLIDLFCLFVCFCIVLENVANLLRVDIYELIDALTQKSMILRGEEIQSPLSVEQVVNQRRIRWKIVNTFAGHMKNLREILATFYSNGLEFHIIYGVIPSALLFHLWDNQNNAETFQYISWLGFWRNTINNDRYFNTNNSIIYLLYVL